MFKVELTLEAIEDLRCLKRNESRRIIDEVEQKLKHEPAVETRNRKKLRPNRLAEWELRIGTFRVFYDVDEAMNVIKIVAVGFKRGSVLFICGEEYEL